MPAAPPSTPIFTVGYGGRSLDALLDLLQRHEIACLVDVRSAPYSRFRPEFSRDGLSASVSRKGIRYVFLGHLLGGRPADPDCYLEQKVVYERVREKEFFRKGIERLRKAADQGMRVALLCSEGKPEECHRSKLIGVALDEIGVPVLHLDENDEPQSQLAVTSRLNGGQLDLFGDPGFTSRKRYEHAG